MAFFYKIYSYLAIIKHIKNRWLIIDDLHYKLNENIIYEPLYVKNPESKLGAYIADYIERSIDALTKQDIFNITTKYRKWQSICKHRTIMTMIGRIVKYLSVDNVFEDENEKIHFLNGYIDLKTGKFNKREIGKDFTCTYINYEYKKSKLEDRKFISNLPIIIMFFTI